MKSTFLLLLFGWFWLNIGQGISHCQDIGSRDKKTLRWIETTIGKGEFTRALNRLDGLSEKYPDDPYLIYLKAICLSNHPQSSYHKETLPLIEKILNNKTAETPIRAWYYRGLNQFRIGDYSSAINSLNEFLARPALGDTSFVKSAKEIKRWCFNQEALQNRSYKDLLINNLGSNFNTASHEYAPLADENDSILLFTSLRGGSEQNRGLEREYPQVAYKKGEIWTEPVWVRVPVSSPNISATNISPDGKIGIFYVSDEEGNGDLFRYGIDTGANKLEPLHSHINSDHTEGSAFCSADQKHIFFSSARPGGFGGRDLYVLNKDENGDWSPAENLGPLVNTAFDEDAPFVSSDGRVLFFQSKGHNSIGGYDLFRCVKIADKWSAPINLGKPINSPYNDSYLSLTKKGGKVYFTSDRPGGFGEEDLYSAHLPDDIHIFPYSVARIQTQINDKEGNGQFLIHSLNGEKPFLQKIDNGLHVAVLEPGKTYVAEWTSPSYGAWYYPFTAPLQRRIYDLYLGLKVSDIQQFGVKAGERTELTVDMGPALIGEPSDNPQDTVGLSVMLAGEALEDGLPDNNGQFSKTLKLFRDDPSKRGSSKIYINEYYLDEEAINRSEYPVFNKTIKGKLLTEKKVLEPTTIEAKANNNTSTLAKKTGKYSGGGASFTDLNTRVVLFDIGKADILGQYQPVLDKTLEELLKEPETRVEVYGFTDATGNVEDNQVLSDRRANMVIDYLLSKGLKRRRIDAYPMGVAQGSIGSSAEDRRVELKIKRPNP